METTPFTIRIAWVDFYEGRKPKSPEKDTHKINSSSSEISQTELIFGEQSKLCSLQDYYILNQLCL